MSRRKTGLPRFLKGIGFKQVNERWSWGAVDHDRKQVGSAFLMILASRELGEQNPEH